MSHAFIKDDKTIARGFKVYCIVVNWNGWSDTQQCLQSLVRQNYPDLQIIVVDNGSSDDSVVRIKEAYPDINLIELTENVGFAKGNNAGIRCALSKGADYLWLLNNDTICPPDTATKLVQKFRSSAAKIGAVGSVLYYLDHPAQIQAWGGGHINTLFAYSSHFTCPQTYGHNDFITFASVLISKEALLSVGSLDERYFMYFEDVDYCLQLKKASFSLAVAEDTAVLHKEGGGSKRVGARTDRNITKSGMLFLAKHSPLPNFSIVSFLLMRIGKRVARMRWNHVSAVWQGYKDFLSDTSA
jgi:GT2 family glycosyltransferase